VYEKRYEVVLQAPVERVWEFHSSAEALKVLTPPNRDIEPISSDLRVVNDAIHELGFRQFGVRMVWRARISQVEPPFGFTDTAEKSPFAYWQHRHEFRPEGSGTRMIDTIRYRPPGGPLGPILNRLLISSDLDRLFAFRHEATKRALET
jgi:ligand-binding SRPBCC domain-containing protein